MGHSVHQAECVPVPGLGLHNETGIQCVVGLLCPSTKLTVRVGNYGQGGTITLRHNVHQADCSIISVIYQAFD